MSVVTYLLHKLDEMSKGLSRARISLFVCSTVSIDFCTLVLRSRLHSTVFFFIFFILVKCNSNKVELN